MFSIKLLDTKNTMSKKILYISNDYDFFIAHRIAYLDTAKKKGYITHFATPKPNRPVENEFCGHIYHPINMRRTGRRFFTELKSFFDILRVIKKVNPDIVHNITVKPVVYGSLASRILGVKNVVNMITGLGSIYINPGIFDLLTQWIIGLTYYLSFKSPSPFNLRVVFQNPDDQKMFLKRKYVKLEETCVILGSGVDISKYIPMPEPDTIPVILYPGRMLWDKGVGDLFEAGKILARKGHKFVIRCCGPIDTINPSGVTEEVIEKWEQETWFEWDGPQFDMLRIFSESHIVCLPSYREGVPLALLEACACGRPIVTTDAPGCREVVFSEKNGFLVPINDPVKLAEKLGILLENKQLRAQMGAIGREYAVNTFSRKAVIGKLLEIYNELAPVKPNNSQQQQTLEYNL